MTTLQKLQNDLKKLQNLRQKASEVSNSHEETLLNALRKKNGPEISMNDICSSPSPSRNNNNHQCCGDGECGKNNKNNDDDDVPSRTKNLDDYLVAGVVIEEPELVALISRIEMSKNQIGAIGKMISEKQNEIDAELNRQKVEEVD
jgi:hypothetical protein